MRLVFSVFFVLGLGLFGGSYVQFRQTRQFLRTAVPAAGTVVEMVYKESSSGPDRNSTWYYFPRVQFQTADGRPIDFVSGSGSIPPAYSVNQSVTVFYDPQKPDGASLNSFSSLWGATLVLAILGVVFTTPRIAWFVWQRAGDRKTVWLQGNGQRIQAQVTGVALDTSLTVNGAHPYRIQCQWLDPASNQMYVFQSGHVWFDPSNYISGKTVDVLVDRNNPRRYAVDASFLPKVV
jgi:hypothetical protein